MITMSMQMLKRYGAAGSPCGKERCLLTYFETVEPNRIELTMFRNSRNHAATITLLIFISSEAATNVECFVSSYALKMSPSSMYMCPGGFNCHSFAFSTRFLIMNWASPA